MLGKGEIWILILKLTCWTMCLNLFNFFQDTTRFLVSFAILYTPGYLFIATKLNRVKLHHLINPHVKLFWESLYAVSASILLGASLDYQLIWINSLVIVYIVLPKVLQGKYQTQQYITIAFTLFVISQLPLDVDFDTDWQKYPFPVILSTEIGHTFGVIYDLASKYYSYYI
ncbi:unnamed protein product [Blepharisma stoltei]|uniref:Uncharacterized protein n=1 Tax=Blepharisma stoltei TaxID=1481888 RepID=A0AAU9KP15_9CILI|nr:unnamed protein product [Blepharisma stoltei]